MILTDEQKAAIAHVVLDADVWADHALRELGEKVVLEKVRKWLPEYLEEKERLGSEYKNRAERELEQQV
jgi:predicted nuclease of restriction endonuclease-like RecB superfamily